MFADAGFTESRTYVQSGNVVVDAQMSGNALAARVSDLITERFGLSIPVVTRTRDELAAVIERDPLGGEGVAEKLYQVTFFDREPPAGLAESVAGLAAEGERFHASGREWYVYHGAGIARSKLASRIAAKNLGIVGTARNWTTVRTLLAMADGEDG